MAMNSRTFFFKFSHAGVSLPSLLFCLTLSLFVITINGQTINIDGTAGGKRFDGIGAVSGDGATSGLLKALNGKGIEDIAELEFTGRNVLAQEFATGWPVLHQARFAKDSLFVLTVPENFGDLYNLPPEVLNRIRNVLSQDLKVRIEGPAQVSLFVYDNDTFIVESFLPENVNIKIIADKQTPRISNVLTGEEFVGKDAQDGRIWGRESDGVKTFDITVKPHSFLVFRENSIF